MMLLKSERRRWAERTTDEEEERKESDSVGPLVRARAGDLSADSPRSCAVGTSTRDNGDSCSLRLSQQIISKRNGACELRELTQHHGRFVNRM